MEVLLCLGPAFVEAGKNSPSWPDVLPFTTHIVGWCNCCFLLRWLLCWLFQLIPHVLDVLRVNGQHTFYVW